ncbi:hypothetical protein BDM02DRAFT_3118393 [Thelephora ganbajun]|uniref:Uncharacterized protein n=1 Tax=Thelephora ganbajun TaxID=370292 RepID=A0ACB6ZAF1_THEGA|nr:hypothetical protein BDM02DRAFT_3118393 [Thelephora ganbajun]
MESKLKALKVADLKEILKRASFTLPPRVTKSDLIAKILAEPIAIDAYNALHGPTGVNSQQDAPPKQKSAAKPDASAKPPANPLVSPKKLQEPAPAPKPASTTTSTTTPVDATPVGDPELEKRKARAARFGIPLVEPKQTKSTDKKSKERQQPPDDETKLKARADRFGVDTSAEGKKQPARKRGAPEEPTDPEELERRKKRAERFGIPLADTSKA